MQVSSIIFNEETTHPQPSFNSQTPPCIWVSELQKQPTGSHDLQGHTHILNEKRASLFPTLSKVQWNMMKWVTFLRSLRSFKSVRLMRYQMHPSCTPRRTSVSRILTILSQSSTVKFQISLVSRNQSQSRRSFSSNLNVRSLMIWQKTVHWSLTNYDRKTRSFDSWLAGKSEN